MSNGLTATLLWAIKIFIDENLIKTAKGALPKVLLAAIKE